MLRRKRSNDRPNERHRTRRRPPNASPTDAPGDTRHATDHTPAHTSRHGSHPITPGQGRTIARRSARARSFFSALPLVVREFADDCFSLAPSDALCLLCVPSSCGRFNQRTYSDSAMRATASVLVSRACDMSTRRIHEPMQWACCQSYTRVLLISPSADCLSSALRSVSRRFSLSSHPPSAPPLAVPAQPRCKASARTWRMRIT
jgi:hypothetical protein